MIPLTIPSALLLYLLLTTLSILGWWFWEHWTNRHQSLSLAEERLQVCEFCQFAYLAPRSKQISRCPQCRSLNKLN